MGCLDQDFVDLVLPFWLVFRDGMLGFIERTLRDNLFVYGFSGKLFKLNMFRFTKRTWSLFGFF